MSKNMQNLVLLIEPSEEAYKIDFEGGNMGLNRFCIDEDAAFESSGVHYLKKTSWDIIHVYGRANELKRKSKCKGYSSRSS